MIEISPMNNNKIEEIEEATKRLLKCFIFQLVERVKLALLLQRVGRL